MNAPAATAMPVATVEVPKGLAASNLGSGARPRAIVPVDIDQVWRLATLIVKSGLAPQGLESAEKVTVAILHGLEIGLPPMMALQRIAVINGRPAVWGDAVPAIALATGLVEDFYESIQGEGDNMVATCRLKRKGIKSQTERTFSAADAKQAGLWDVRERVKRKKRDGTVYEKRNDSPWHCYPKRMLQMRARVAFRDLFADALGGLYIAEELIGVGIESDEARAARARDVTPTEPVKGKARDLPQTVAQPTAQAVEESPDDEIIEDDDETTSEEETETQATTAAPKPAGGKPLPPLARGARAAPAQEQQAKQLEGEEAEALEHSMITDIGKLDSMVECGTWAQASMANKAKLSPAAQKRVDTAFSKRQDGLRD